MKLAAEFEWGTDLGGSDETIISRLHQQPVYRKKAKFKGNYPVTTRLSRQGLNLPTMYAMTEADIRYIADILRELGR